MIGAAVHDPSATSARIFYRNAKCHGATNAVVCCPLGLRGQRMRRREFISLLVGAAISWPLAARAQQPAIPVVAFLDAAPLEADVLGLAEFRKGLSEIGYVEGQNVMIEYRSAEGQADRLPALAADMVRRKVAVIATMANNAAVAAKATATTIPIVFTIGGDPIKMGLVDSLNRPGGNITGVSFLSSDVVTKMLEALHELMPKAARIAALVNLTNQNAAVDTKEAETAARTLGLELQVLNASNAGEIDDAFALLVERRAAALLIEGDPFFIARMRQLVVLTARHAIPAIYQSRDFPDAGGLMSYGAKRSDALRLAGGYTGRILKGERPVDLPVQLATKLELVINLNTAKAFRLDVPPTLLARADEVIE
jgi:putative ABC transport system substrate-binding protein